MSNNRDLNWRRGGGANFFVQNQESYQAILGQPYITATKMKTKVFDDDSQYAKIRSLDRSNSI